jgi:hypothetical protein
MEYLNKARTNRLVQFGVFCNRVLEYKQIPTSVFRELSDFDLSLTAMKADDTLKEIAENRLEVLRHIKDYANAHKAGKLEEAPEVKAKAIAAHKAGDKLIDALLENGGDGFV